MRRVGQKERKKEKKENTRDHVEVARSEDCASGLEAVLKLLLNLSTLDGGTRARVFLITVAQVRRLVCGKLCGRKIRARARARGLKEEVVARIHLNLAKVVDDSAAGGWKAAGTKTKFTLTFIDGTLT